MRSSTSRPFTPEALARVLFEELKLSPAARYCVAFSGGPDSTVLLHALTALPGGKPRLLALHADHGLVPDSSLWADRCRRFCEALGVPIEVYSLKVVTDPSLGVEASARQARYRWFAEVLGESDVLLTAQHQDDQAETVLLRLLRGAGVHGLAGMPALRRLGGGWLARPLLGFSREALLTYGSSQRLEWIEDPANRDLRFDRSFLRWHILPHLRQRWPAVCRRLVQTAAHMHMAGELLDDLAAVDTFEAQPGPIPWSPGRRVLATPLVRLSPARRANALRFLLRRWGYPVPDADCLKRVLAWLDAGSSVAGKRVSCAGLEFRRYEQWLEVAAPLPPVDRRWRWKWTRFPEPLFIPELGVRLAAEPGDTAALAADRVESGSLTVGLRQGGECVRLPGRAHHQTLKNLLNAARIPPWHRDRLPLLFVDGEFAALPGVCVSAACACQPGERGWRIQMIVS